MITSNIITWLVLGYFIVAILNYVFSSVIVFITFDILKGKDIDRFFALILQKEMSEYYGFLQALVIIPFYGIVYGIVFLVRFFKAKDKGYKDYYALAEAYGEKV